jgi:hypothetical protein
MHSVRATANLKVAMSPGGLAMREAEFREPGLRDYLAERGGVVTIAVRDFMEG